MSALASLERRFLDHVRGSGCFPRAECAEGVVDSDIGLAIYANAYRFRLCEALETDHPVLAIYLGDELWSRFCKGYIDAHPSRYRSLRQFGARVPDFLAAHEPFAAHPLIAELAAFERNLLDVFDAADVPRADWSVMQQLEAASWPGLRLRFHPSVRTMATCWNSVEVWQALKDGTPPATAQAAQAPARLLWRDCERITRFRAIDTDEYAAISASLDECIDFAGLCERLAQRHPADRVPAIAIGFLRTWFDEGLILQVAKA
jgi:hypothetical protein